MNLLSLVPFLFRSASNGDFFAFGLPFSAMVTWVECCCQRNILLSVSQPNTPGTSHLQVPMHTTSCLKFVGRTHLSCTTRVRRPHVHSLPFPALEFAVFLRVFQFFSSLFELQTAIFPRCKHTVNFQMPVALVLWAETLSLACSESRSLHQFGISFQLYLLTSHLFLELARLLHAVFVAGTSVQNSAVFRCSCLEFAIVWVSWFQRAGPRGRRVHPRSQSPVSSETGCLKEALPHWEPVSVATEEKSRRSTSFVPKH